MRFTCNMQENVSNTRALMKSDFMVSTYKSFQQTGQQTVMDTYHVRYSTTGTDWDGNVHDNWNYVNVDNQIERYWDYNSFPYRFNAIAPYPTDKSKISLTDIQLTIEAPYKMQTCMDGSISPDDRAAEPYWLAQVQRGTDGKDLDVIANKEITNASTSLNRYVALPFHHLNSKIRFAIYSLLPWTTANPMHIRNLSIKVVPDPDNTSDTFVTAAGKYMMSGVNWYNGIGTSGFTDLTRKPLADPIEILHYTGVEAGNPNVPLEGNDLSQWQGKSSAFWFKCKDGIMQIPQEGVRMTVSMELFLIDGGDVVVLPLNDIPVKFALEGAEPTEQHNWQSGNIYTYYLILDNVNEKLEIDFTATLTPWEDISGSLSTDLEQ